MFKFELDRGGVPLAGGEVPGGEVVEGAGEVPFLPKN